MKKIVGLSLTALLIVAAVGSATWAYFNDTEVSQNNIITAGTLDLQVGTSDPCLESINIGSLQPGDSGNAADWTIANRGNTSGTLKVAVSAVVDYENTRTEPEEAAGDTTGGSTEGELSSFVKIALWLDINRSGVWDSGDKYLRSNGTVVDWASGSTPPAEAYDYIINYAGLEWDAADGVPAITGSGSLDFMVEYNFPSDANDNRAQSDSGVFDLTITLEQVIV
jgi:predicted ribosomally synthesized peptide with SipW-like signal peptide